MDSRDGHIHMSVVVRPLWVSVMRLFRIPPIATILLLAACATSGGVPAVPAPMPETIPLPPVSAEALRWRPGHWNWTGSGYTWTQGEYVPQAGTGTRWMPGHWTQSSGGRVWNPPHWVN
jgi:hypothetical protein